MEKKNPEKVFFSRDNCIWIDCVKIVSIKKRMIVIGSQCVNKQPQGFAYY